MELYGVLDPNTRDWTDGLLSNIFREINKPTDKNERRYIGAVEVCSWLWVWGGSLEALSSGLTRCSRSHCTTLRLLFFLSTRFTPCVDCFAIRGAASHFNRRFRHCAPALYSHCEFSFSEKLLHRLHGFYHNSGSVYHKCMNCAAIPCLSAVTQNENGARHLNAALAVPCENAFEIIASFVAFSALFCLTSVFDGDVDALWVENMNSVMDDNRLLTLANSERIRLQKHCALLFEVRITTVLSSGS